MINTSITGSNRREATFVRPSVRSVLPDHFWDMYPDLIMFLEAYYRFMEQPENPAKEIHDIFLLSDITEMDPRFLEYMQQQLLLGQNSFKGLSDARIALKLSNMLYKSKGTRFSTEQFFRIFFGEDVEVVYTKENVFILNEDLVGAESLRYLVDDKLYQTFAILIKTGVAVTEWLDLYKLFVHPAGLYVGGQVVVNSISSLFGPGYENEMPYFDPRYQPEAPAVKVESIALYPFAGPTYQDLTSIRRTVGQPGGDSNYRVDLDQTILAYSSMTTEVLNKQYNDIEEVMSANSPTFDMDSSVADPRTIRISNTVETVDQYIFKYRDSV